MSTWWVSWLWSISWSAASKSSLDFSESLSSSLERLSSSQLPPCDWASLQVWPLFLFIFSQIFNLGHFFSNNCLNLEEAKMTLFMDGILIFSTDECMHRRSLWEAFQQEKQILSKNILLKDTDFIWPYLHIKIQWGLWGNSEHQCRVHMINTIYLCNLQPIMQSNSLMKPRTHPLL